MLKDDFKDLIKPDAIARLSEDELSRFPRNEHFYRATFTMLGTDGVKFVADTADAAWILDFISSAQGSPEIGAAGVLQVWELTVDLAARTGVLAMSDASGNQLYRQALRYTRFPVAYMKFYCAIGKYGPVLMLPSEY